MARSDGKEAAAQATAIAMLFRTHVAKENDLLLPVLVADPETDLAALLGTMHGELMGTPRALVSQSTAEPSMRSTKK